MIITVMSKGKPMVYRDFQSAKERAFAGDIIYEGDKEYVVPDYVAMQELESQIKGLGKFSNLRRILELRLKDMVKIALKYEERIKND